MKASDNENLFAEYEITDEYVQECVSGICTTIRNANYKLDGGNYESVVNLLIRLKYPKLTSFLEHYGVGTSSFLFQFRTRVMRELNKDNEALKLKQKFNKISLYRDWETNRC